MREKKTVSQVQVMEEKRNITRQFLQEFDVQSSEDIQDALEDLPGGTIREKMKAEMDEHLGYGKSERSDNNDSCNGYKVDGLTGIRELITAVYHKSEYQCFIVHQVHNTMKYESNKG